ncbi:MAG: AEC family transporter [Huintestinicola sp.]|uniref:AEC family transporter n=1 Tax=Huintestinicola sp. TaxID=2981661 RepID=UPI003EFF3266
MALMILDRIAVMLAYMIPGYVLYKKRIISDQGAKDIGKLLIYIILPAAIINSYNMGYTPERAMGLLLSFLAAAAALALSVILSRLLFGGKQPIESFGAAFSNAGFMGIPLISSVIGQEAVYYAAAFVAILNILQWTYGVYLITGNRSAVSAKKILLNPVIISFFIGVILFFLPVRLPAFISDILGTISQMNAPISMLTVGTYLAQVPIGEIFTDKKGYAVSAARLLVIPLLTAVMLAVLPFGDDTMRLTVIILAAAPVGSNVAVYAQIYGGDHKRAVRETVLSTLLCVLTMPLVIGISERILQNIP